MTLIYYLPESVFNEMMDTFDRYFNATTDDKIQWFFYTKPLDYIKLAEWISVLNNFQ